DIKFTAKTLTYYKASNGPGQILGMRPGPPPSGYYDYHLVDLLRRPSSTTGIPPAPPRTKTTSSCAALPLPDRRRFTTTMPANYTTTIGPLGHRGNDGRGALGRSRWDDETCNLGLRWQNLVPNNGWNYNDVDALFPSWTRADRGERPSHLASSRLNQPLHRATAPLANLSPQGIDTKASKIEFSYTSGLFKDGAAHEPAGTCTTAIIFVQRLTNTAQLARTLATPCSPVLKTSAAAVVPAVQRIAPAPCTCTARQKPNDDDKTGVGTAAKPGHVPYTTKTRGGTSVQLNSSPAGSGISGNTTASKSDVKDDGGDKQKGRG
ncbi:hypothetical protein NHJ13051_003491, partial [Beauveria bassiana]